MNPLPEEIIVNVVPDPDRLEDLLERSAPSAAPVDAAVRVELEHLSANTRSAVHAGSRRSRWVKPAVAGVASGLFLGGAATAAAATGLWLPPWWEESGLTSFTYTLPSGAECEDFVGNVRGWDPASVAVVEDFYRETDLQVLLDPDAIESTIQQIRSEENSTILEDGTTVPSGYGTEYYDADMEYTSAVSRILSSAISAELDAEGLGDVDSNLSYEGRTTCPVGEL